MCLRRPGLLVDLLIAQVIILKVTDFQVFLNILIHYY